MFKDKETANGGAMKIGKNKELFTFDKNKIYILKLRFSDYKYCIPEVQDFFSTIDDAYQVTIIPFFVKDVQKSAQFEEKTTQ